MNLREFHEYCMKFLPVGQTPSLGFVILCVFSGAFVALMSHARATQGQWDPTP